MMMIHLHAVRRACKMTAFRDIHSTDLDRTDYVLYEGLSDPCPTGTNFDQRHRPETYAHLSAQKIFFSQKKKAKDCATSNKKHSVEKSQVFILHKKSPPYG